MAQRILVVGGVAAGAGAAVKARRTDEDAEIILFERGPHPSFANCGLPYFVGGQIAEEEQLLVVAPERLRRRYRLDIRLRQEVTAINREAADDHGQGACNGTGLRRAVRPAGAGHGVAASPAVLARAQLPGVFTLTTVADAVAIRAYIEEHDAHYGAVLGGGYIGLESVEALVAMGLRDSLIERLDRLMPVLSPEMSVMIGKHLKENGVQVHLGHRGRIPAGRGTAEGPPFARRGGSPGGCHHHRRRGQARVGTGAPGGSGR